MGQGPDHFLQLGLDHLLRDSGHDVLVTPIEVADPFPTEIGTGFELCRVVADHVRAAIQHDRFPLVLSGNCDIAVGTTTGAMATQLGIIWFDGHADFNTPELTFSGFLDGMGLAIAAGQCWTTMAATIPGFQPIPAAHIVHLGGRLRAMERTLFNRAGVTSVEASVMRQLGLSQALAPALTMLRARVERVYVHLDLDVLDPAYAQANEFARPDGLLPDEVQAAIVQIKRQFTICASGVASYDPACDTTEQAFRAGVQLIQSILAPQ